MICLHSSYVRNTPRSRSLFDLAWENYQNNRNLRQQPALNNAIDVMLREKLRMQLLPLNKFAPGWVFFENLHYNSLDSLPCKFGNTIFYVGDDCVMFHNNWIVSSNAKEYRLKELGLYHSMDSYYSNSTAKYITYESLSPDSSIGQEEKVLASALLTAIALNRILILPEFKCHRDNEIEIQNEELFNHPQNVCTMNTYWCIRQFDEAFALYYREHISSFESSFSSLTILFLD